ncbi:MAG: GH3 auxin-responsive promoter family protein [Bacteroidales bacterium]|nr:GH3 auxin-responsive promoter family protein [Bacteroidales bacterium]
MITQILRPLFLKGADATLKAATRLEEVQRQQLISLLKQGANTQWGLAHGFSGIRSYSDWQGQPVTPYEELRPWVMKMVGGEKDILWPGVTRRFAQSSGTSDGKSKYIPLTEESLTACHYRGGKESVAHYLRLYPESRVFDGQAFILGGSFANELKLKDRRVKVGDLSAHLIERINPLANLVRIPKKEVALMADWKEKLPRLVETALRHRGVTNISGVPSWWLTVLRAMMKKAGAESLHDIWPRLEVFFHGGIAFGPYREQYQAITDPKKMHFLETYNASEGFFAVQTTREPGPMMLLPDAGVFYELQRLGDEQIIPVWEAVEGEVYGLIITSCNGLWRYPLGDTIKIESTAPILKISLAGRTRHFINAFGEEVMVYNTDAALTKACQQMGCEALNYTAAPVYTTDKSKGHHQWVIEWAKAPDDLHAFERCLDDCLRAENSDYDAKRSSDIFLSPLTIVNARPGLFDQWLAATGKLGGQRKVARLANDRHIIDELLRINEEG